MKHFFVLFPFLFCIYAHADTIDLHWGVDNQTYDTTTCTVGGDVTLPTPPTKRGHTFIGWTAEHFDRGRFVDWDSVPTSMNSYSIDTHNNKTPLNGDYIIINNTCSILHISDVNSITFYHEKNYQNFKYDYYDASTGITARYILPRSGVFGLNDELRASVPGNGYIYIYANNINNTIYNYKLYNTPDEEIVKQDWTVEDTFVFYFPNTSEYSCGTCRFVYDGVWDVDGKNGWKPDYQIINNQNE